MKVRLETSGGFANLRIEGELDTGELSPELAQRIEDGLASETMRKAATVERPELVDGAVYELTILPQSEDEERRHYVIDDATAEDGLLAIIDDILHEIVRRRREESRAAREGDG